MNFTRRILYAIACTGLLVAGCRSDLQEKNENLKSDVQRLQDQVESCENQRERCQGQQNQLQKCLTSLRQKIQKMEEVDIEITNSSSISCGNVSKIRISKLDLQRQWVYLRYFINGEVRWSDKLDYGRKNRSSLFIEDENPSVLIQIHSCNEDETCNVSCREVMPPDVTCD